MNLADHTPTNETPTRCNVCVFADTLDATNRVTFNDWTVAILAGHLRRSQVRAAIHNAGGPLLSESAFARHMRNHT